jgi:hypothetical protein
MVVARLRGDLRFRVNRVGYVATVAAIAMDDKHERPAGSRSAWSSEVVTDAGAGRASRRMQ